MVGEHTDYNDGFVLPCAIDYHIACCISPAPGTQLQVMPCVCDMTYSYRWDMNHSHS